MPVTLLDLTDETLQRIAYFANRDSKIPIPSYGAHWQNFKGDIRARNCRDALSFRLTCKRIHQACGMKNVHLFISEYKTMKKWLNNAPVEAEKSITRLRIHWSNDTNDNFGAWTSLTGLLNVFCNLEELVITASPTCVSYYRCQPGLIATRPRIPRYPILTNLKSLSITLRCQTCAISLPLSLIPAAKNLEHLKIRLVGLKELFREDEIDTNDNDNDNPEYRQYHPAERIRQLVKEWCQGDDNRRNQLKSLFLRYPALHNDHIKSAYPETVKQVLESFPMLEDLRITQYHPNPEFLAAGIEIMARKKDSRWQLRIKTKGDTVDGEKFNTLNDLLQEFGSHRNLKYFDPIIVVRLRSLPFFNPTALHYTTLRSYLKSRPPNQYYEEETQRVKSHHITMQEAMKFIIDTLVEHFPSLEGGALWESGTDTNELDWFRWEWSKTTCQGGKPKIIIDKFPGHFTHTFVGAREGLRTPDRGVEDDRASYPGSDQDHDSDSDSNSGSDTNFEFDSEDEESGAEPS